MLPLLTGTHGTHCNQLVALVLHSPRERPVEGGERPVTMDVWRIWSQKKGNAEFHQMVITLSFPLKVSMRNKQHSRRITSLLGHEGNRPSLQEKNTHT